MNEFPPACIGWASSSSCPDEAGRSSPLDGQEPTKKDGANSRRATRIPSTGQENTL